MEHYVPIDNVKVVPCMHYREDFRRVHDISSGGYCIEVKKLW